MIAVGAAGLAIAEADDPGTEVAAGVETEAAAGAARPRLRSNAFNSSISAFIAASSLATAGGIPGSGVGVAESEEAAEGPALPGFADALALLEIELSVFDDAIVV